jgi:hypothetical protein
MAWGERGHDIITRVAVQHLVFLTGDARKLTEPFIQKDHLLSHLSSVPDVVWRSDSMTQYERDQNDPTHYLDLELAYAKVESMDDLDLTYNNYQKAAKQHGPHTHKDIGSATWRVLQLHGLMIDSLLEIKSDQTREAKINSINSALLYAGLMSHFVADLSNPHHVTANYDGQLTGQKGLHRYFETDIVSALPLTLIVEVETASSVDLLPRTLFANQSTTNVDAQLDNPRALVLSLIVNSFSLVDELHQLDTAVSLLENNTDPNLHAKRKPPSETALLFKPLVVERLAVGATVLARLWWAAWVAAERPDMSDYFSYYYPVAPGFVEPDYLNAKVE